jgi:hypothetical protein
MSDYKFTDQDIDGMMLYLKAFQPEHADEETAVLYLQYVKDKSRDISLGDLTNENLHQFFEAFLRSKQ